MLMDLGPTAAQPSIANRVKQIVAEEIEKRAM
jgi:hypothetical protein